jgi:hypothetical protein
MRKEEPIGPDGPERSHFRQLSAGSVEGAGGARRSGPPGASVFNDNQKPQASVQSASLSGLERAVASTSESARTLERVRAALEEVSLANKAAAQTQAPDVDSAAQAAEKLSNHEDDSQCGSGKPRHARCSPKTWQGLLG